LDHSSRWKTVAMGVTARFTRPAALSLDRLGLPPIARHFAADGGARTLESGGYSRRTPAHLQLRLQQTALFQT
jgi:hypothetical protein